MTVDEAKEVGLVSKIFPHDNFLQHVKEELSFLPSVSKQVDYCLNTFHCLPVTLV